MALTIRDISANVSKRNSVKPPLNCGVITPEFISIFCISEEATVEIYAREITIKTAWSNYTYRLFVLGDNVWCEYNGAYRGLLEQNLLPTITPREGLLESEVLDSSLYGSEKRKLREYAEDNLKLKKFRRENFNEDRTGVAHFDHPKRVYDEFIKEDYVVPSSDE